MNSEKQEQDILEWSHRASGCGDKDLSSDDQE